MFTLSCLNEQLLTAAPVVLPLLRSHWDMERILRTFTLLVITNGTLRCNKAPKKSESLFLSMDVTDLLPDTNWGGFSLIENY